MGFDRLKLKSENIDYQKYRIYLVNDFHSSLNICDSPNIISFYMVPVGLNAQNIFNSIKFDYKASSINYNNTYAIAVEGLVLKLTASYSFKNFQNKQRGRSDDASFKGGGAF